MKMTQTYRTSDIYVASYLLSKGLELQGIDRRNAQRCDFIFIDSKDRPNLVRAFMCGQAEGNLPNFLYHFKRAEERRLQTKSFVKGEPGAGVIKNGEGRAR